MFNNIMGFPLLEECEILDMSHDYSNETVVWGTRDPFRLDAYFKGLLVIQHFQNYTVGISLFQELNESVFQDIL